MYYYNYKGANLVSLTPQEGLGAPDNASFAAWVATNDIVRSQIDERILQAAEQGLPFKGGDL